MRSLVVVLLGCIAATLAPACTAHDGVGAVGPVEASAPAAVPVTAAPSGPATAPRTPPSPGAPEKACHAKSDCAGNQDCVFDKPGCEGAVGACREVDPTCSMLPVAIAVCGCDGKLVTIGACPATVPHRASTAGCR